MPSKPFVRSVAPSERSSFSRCNFLVISLIFDDGFPSTVIKRRTTRFITWSGPAAQSTTNRNTRFTRQVRPPVSEIKTTSPGTDWGSCRGRCELTTKGKSRRGVERLRFSCAFSSVAYKSRQASGIPNFFRLAGDTDIGGFSRPSRNTDWRA